MKRCWDDWMGPQEVQMFIKDGTYCQPCYIIDFENKNLEIKNFNKYLLETNIRGERYTYSQYFTGTTNDKDFKASKIANNPTIQEQLRKEDESFTTDKKYAIIYYHIKDRDKIQEKMDELKMIGGGAGALGATGLVIGGTICLFIPGVNIACGAAAVFGGAGAIGGGLLGSKLSPYLADHPLYVSSITLREFRAETFKELECTYIPGEQKEININTNIP
jgi:hypothetical protein